MLNRAARGGGVVTSSLKIAEVFGKQHKVVLKAIRELECPEKFSEHNFMPAEYADAQGKPFNKNVKGESSGQFWLKHLNSPKMGLYYNKREGKNVKLINKILIDDYQQKHADSVKPLENWKELVKLAKWHTPQDIRNAIRSADFLSGNRVIFNIGGNRHRLVVVVVYTAGQVYVQWIGTHAEYSKRKF